MNDATETPIEPRSRETVTRDRICLAADNRKLTKRERNEEIAGLVTAFLTCEGHFEDNDGEISFVDHGAEVYPLTSFFERQPGDLLDQLGVYEHGTYMTDITSVTFSDKPEGSMSVSMWAVWIGHRQRKDVKNAEYFGSDR